LSLFLNNYFSLTGVIRGLFVFLGLMMRFMMVGMISLFGRNCAMVSLLLKWLLLLMSDIRI